MSDAKGSMGMFGTVVQVGRSAARGRMRQAALACLERLEARTMLSGVLSYTVPDAGTHAMTLSLVSVGGATSTLQLTDNGVIEQQMPLANATGVVINGAAGADALTVDFGGGNPLPAGVALTFNGGGAANSLVLKNGSFAAETWTASGPAVGAVALDAANIAYTNIGRITDTAVAGSLYLTTSGANDPNVSMSDGPGGTVEFGGAFVTTDVSNKAAVTLDTAGANDTVALQNTAAAGMQTFALDGNFGSDNVHVRSTPVGVTTVLNSTQGGYENIVIGSAGSVQGVLGPVQAIDDTGGEDLLIDDSADPVGRSVTLNRDSLSGLAPALISYDENALNSLTVDGGSGGNAFVVATTPSSVVTMLNAGTGNDSVQVDAVLGGSTLDVNGQAGHDQVDVQLSVFTNYGNENGFQTLLGRTNVSNVGGSTDLTVDTSAMTSTEAIAVQPGMVTINTTVPRGAASVAVNYALGGASTLDVKGGTANDNFTVLAGLPTTLNGGAGADAFTITPGAATVNVDGGAPAPPASPGDQLSLNLANATVANSNMSASASGYAGSISFTNAQAVTFENIETPPGGLQVASADLALTFTGPPSVSEDGTLTYKFTVTNLGPSSATNVMLSDALPAGSGFISSSIGTPIVSGTGMLSLSLGMLASGAGVSGTLSISAGEEGVSIANTASVASDVADPVSSNNAATVNTMVLDVPVAPTGGLTVTAVEGTATGMQAVATFVDPAGAEPLADYSATINWGDGSSSAGAITFNAGVFTVSGSHTYAAAGTDTIAVVIHHDTAPDASTTSTAAVADPAVMVTGGLTYTGTEGAPGTMQTLATFTDPGGTAPLSEYVATIDWGDGTTSAGTVAQGSTPGTMVVLGSHNYGDEGGYTITVSVDHGTAPTGSDVDAAAIADPSVVATGGLTFADTVGTPAVMQPIATFTDPAGPEALSNYFPLVNWGDGNGTFGTVVAGPTPNTFVVMGAHDYAQSGNYTITVKIAHEQSAPTIVTSTAMVTDPALVVTGGYALSGVAGQMAAAMTLATFSDPEGSFPASNYQALVQWADGTTSTATIANGATAGTFVVTGAHQYASGGTYHVVVSVNRAGAAANQAVSVTDSMSVTGGAVAPSLGSVAIVAPINEGGTVHLTGKILAGNLSAMSLSVNWGPGQGTSTYALAAGATSFDVTHLYPDNPAAPATAFPVSVTLANSAGSAMASASAAVNNLAPVLAPIVGPSSGVRGQTLSFKDAFSDAGVLDTHTASINWGDGSKPSTAAVVESGGSGAASSAHAYSRAGTYKLTLRVTDKDGATATMTQTVVVSAMMVEPDPTLGGSMLVIGAAGSGSSVTVQQANGPHGSGALRVIVDGTTTTVSDPVGRVVIYGEGAGDMLQVSPNVTLPAYLYGGSGGGNVLIGGGGPSVLVGAGGNNLLAAGTGRSILIGGGGANLLLGGSADDVLVSGSTAYDHNDAAMAAMLNEWNRSAVSYAARVADLANGGGLNGSYVLNKSTVNADSTGSLLLGRGGADWFLFNTGDLILDRAPGEVATRV